MTKYFSIHYDTKHAIVKSYDHLQAQLMVIQRDGASKIHMIKEMDTTNTWYCKFLYKGKTCQLVLSGETRDEVKSKLMDYYPGFNVSEIKTLVEFNPDNA
ncbi:MAG: hypothetical protein ACRDBG_17120 [Waterburya sp.]